MATLTLDEFLPKARQLNPDYTDEEHIQAYEQRYGRSKPVQTVSSAPLTTYESFLPKARALNPDYSDDEHYAAWQEKYGARGAREKDQGDFVRGGVTAFKQIPQTVRGLEAGAGAIGEKIAGEGGLFTALKEHGLKGYQEYAADIAKDSKPSDSVTDAYKMAKAGDAGALVDWLQYALGYGGGQALQMLATAGIGYAGGKLALQPAAKVVAEKMIAKESARLAATGMAGAQLAKQAVSNVAGKIGQIGAIGATAVGMEGGEIYGGLVEKAAAEGRSLTGEELAKAAGATLGAGILEFVGDKIGLDLVLGKSVASKLVSSRLGHAAAAGSLGTVTESGTEFTQTLLEEFGKGNDPFAPESIKQAVDSAAMGGVGGSSMGTAGGLLSKPQGRDEQPIVTERTPEDMGMAQRTPLQIEGPTQPLQLEGPTGAPGIEGPPLPGQMQRGTVYGDGPVDNTIYVSPLPDITPVTQAKTLDDAIAGAVGVVQGATDTAKSRAAEFARMTSKARKSYEEIISANPEKRPAFEVPTLPGPEAQPATLLNQPSPIVPGQAFTPRPEPIDDPRARLAEERARLVAQRDQQRLTSQNPVSDPVAPVQAVEPADTPLPSQVDLAYPSSKQVRDLIHEKGLHLDTPVFQEILKQTVGKQKFSDLTPQELQTLAEKVQKIKAPQPPTPTQEAPPQVPLTPTEPKERAYAPVTTIPEAQVPRSELTPEKNAEILLRAEKAKADMEIAGTERGGRFFQEQQGTGSTQEVTGLKSPTPDWYKDLTSGKSPAIRGDRKQSAREKIETAIQKIIKDQGADRGKAVEQVKAALLADTEFHKTEWGRDLNSIMQGQWPSYMDKPEGVTQTTGNAEESQNVPRGTHEVTVEEPKPKKVPLSRTERLAQQKQKMEAKKPEPSPSNAPEMETQPATASPERAPAPSTSEAAPKMEEVKERKSPISVPAEEPFSLSAPEVSKPKAKDTGPEQLGIEIPPETIGSRPIIGREATLDEAPLFSKNAQEKDPEQISLDRATIPAMATDRGPGSSESAQTPPEPGREWRDTSQQALENSLTPVRSKVPFTSENVDNISRALLAVKEEKIGAPSFSRIVAANLPLPPENEQGSKMAGDIYVGSIEDNLSSYFGDYLNNLGIPYLKPDGEPMRFGKAGDRSTYEIRADSKAGAGEGKRWYQIGKKGANFSTGIPATSEDDAWSQFEKRFDGRVQTFGDPVGGGGIGITSPVMRQRPELYDVIISEFRKNPTKLLQWLRQDLESRREEESASLWFFDKAMQDMAKRSSEETPEGKRAKFQLIQGGKSLPNSSSPQQRGHSPSVTSPDTTPANQSEPPQSIAPNIAPAQSNVAQFEKPAQSPTEIIADALRTAADKIEGKQSIIDVGEKVGGARKDLAGKSEEKAAKPKPEGPAWERRYQVSQIVSSRYPGEEGKWTIRDTKKTDWKGQPRQVGWLFDTEEEAKRMIPVVVVAETHRVYKDRDGKWEIFKKSGDRKLIHVVNQKFDTEEDAKRYLAQNAAEILETKTFFGEEILPRPEKVERIGTDRRNGHNVDANDFKDTFGFRAVEFGNWQNQDDRQELMNYAYDGLHDLAETLKIPPRAIGLNGDLALAFGSRGHGLSGAAAHYERNYGVINLTKMQGAGHLAHEWFHAADHYFGRQDTKASSEKEKNERGDLVYKAKGPSQDYASHGFRATGSQIRLEVREAYKALIRTMLQKGEQFVEDAQRADRFVAEARKRVAEQLDTIRNGRYGGLSVKVEYGKRNTAPATAEQLAEFDAIAQRILEGETFEQRFISSDMAKKSRRYVMAGRWSNDALEKISGIYKAVRGRSGFGSGDQKGVLDDLRHSMNFYKERLKMLADAQAGTEKTKQVPTSFAMEAKSMDQGRKESYWATEHEMAARAFAAYVEDKLKADGKKSDFITYQTFGAVPTIWGWKKPYPEGAERDAINQAFDKFVGVLQTKETDRGVALYNERNAGRAAPTEEQFAQGFREGLSIPGTEQLLIDTSQEFPNELMTQLSTKQYVRQLTTELNKVFNSMKRVLVGSDPVFQSISFAALSPDSYYYGVNDRGPDRVALNPWAAMHEAQKELQAGRITEAQVPDYLAAFLLDTMVHEFTHQQVITTHRDAQQESFLQAEEQNHATLGTRLTMLHRQLSAVLTGGANGTIEGIRADLRQQQAFWRKGAELSASDSPVTSEPTYARRRQGVSGEGASGRTGPPTDLFGSRASETGALDEGSGVQRSETETGTIDPPTAKERLAAAPDKLRPYLLGALGLEQLSQVYGKDHAEVKAYNQATQDMEADFTEMSRDSDKVARAWTALKIPVADKMAQVMEDARFLNFDPDPQRGQSIGGRKGKPTDDIGMQYGLDGQLDELSQKKQKLRERFEQLPAEAQAVYRQARDFYTNMAEQRFQALKERIERAGGTPENTRKLVDRLQLAYEKVRSKVYFPFSRFGENIVIAKQIKDGKETDREVHAFESVAEAQKFATMMKLKGWQVKQTVAREYSVDKEGPASKIVRQMHDIIKELGQGQQGLPGVLNLEDQLLDSLNQSFLQALPDMSYAKHFIHAKDVKGASKDALRAFAHSALHGAHHISRIRHADKVTKALLNLDKTINDTVEGDTTEARQVYNELVARHNDIMNPNTHPVSAWLGQLGFTMSLGGVVATGITNATQVPLVTYPWLGARYGFGKASAALARAYKDFLDPRTLNKESLFDATKSKLISESERKMLLDLAKRGHIDLTQTMDLAGLSSRDNLSRKARTLGTVGEKVTRMLGFTFHVPEVMNRQVTALATFRLEKAKDGATYESALEKAEQAIKDTHFLYQCVDTETECMTPSGWKKYDELQVGETIYGTDESGALVETTVEAVNIHRGEHKVLSMANQDGFNMVVTENHRCVTQLYDTRLKKWLKPRLTEARDLQYFHTLLRAPIGVNLPRESVYADDFVALLAWVLADGHYRKNSKSVVTISQSIARNPHRVVEIEELLIRLGGHYRKDEVFDKRRPSYHGINFVLRRPLSYAIREAMPGKKITPEFIKKLTVDQMRLFIDTFGKGDGHRCSGLRITQKDRGTLDLLQIMATITGNSSYVSDTKRERFSWSNLYICSTTKRSYVKCLKPERIVVDTVWCPTTTCGTWIARRGGRTFVTGNSFNRPRYMQGNFLRVLTQFKQYSQNIAYTYGRAASIWLDRNNATKEERTVAKRQLLSMLALQFGAAGALGMPFFGAPLDLLMAVVSAMGDDDDEKRDWEVSLRKWLDGTAISLAEAFIDDKEKAREVGRTIGATVSHGVSRLTPWDMAGRLGQNDLFFREPQREREGRQAVMDWMLSLGGPVPSYGVNFLLGLGDVAKGMTELNGGFFMRGVEELTPAVLRHGVKSLRYTLEGVRTRDEYKQLDLDTSEKLGQIFGFTPARVAEMYESTTAVKNKEHRILNQQKALKDRFARAVDDQDDNAKQRILDDIRGFNERNPMFAITSNTLNRSLKTRRQHEAGMERGMYLPPRRRALLEEGDFGDF